MNGPSFLHRATQRRIKRTGTCEVYCRFLVARDPGLRVFAGNREFLNTIVTNNSVYNIATLHATNHGGRRFNSDDVLDTFFWTPKRYEYAIPPFLFLFVVAHRLCL